jgi:tetraacyldisaccharide 4'-kinase
MSEARRQPPTYWFDGRTPPWPARLLAGAYASAVAARAALYRRGLLRSAHPGRPVLVVGNLIAGGSGKTPLTIAIVERLLAEGFRPGVASRGYGREQPSTARWVEPGTDTLLGGDEPVLIARRTGVPVRVDRDRVAAARALIDAGCDIVVCDDGLQHYRLARDLEIEVIDGRRRYGNRRPLPAGPMREPPSRGERCDFRVVNLGDDHAEAGFGEWPMRLSAHDALPLRGHRVVPLSAFAGQRVHAVAGIGDPERFFAMLRGLEIAVVPHGFPDHHRYRAEDLGFASELPVLMTEKDAVKCATLATEYCYSVPIRAQLPEAFWVALLDRVHHAARTVSNKE